MNCIVPRYFAKITRVRSWPTKNRRRPISNHPSTSVRYRENPSLSNCNLAAQMHAKASRDGLTEETSPRLKRSRGTSHSSRLQSYRNHFMLDATTVRHSG